MTTIVVALSLVIVLGQTSSGVAVEQASAGLIEESAALPTQIDSGGCWHQVQEGETLRSISRDYFGTARQWRFIQQANGVDPVPVAGTALWIPAAFGSEMLVATQ